MKVMEAIGVLLILAMLLPKLADMMFAGLMDTQKRQAADHLGLGQLCAQTSDHADLAGFSHLRPGDIRGGSGQ